MKLILKAIDMEYDGPTLDFKKEISIPIPSVTPKNFTRDFAIKCILEAQEKKDLVLQWIDKEKIGETNYFYDHRDSIGLKLDLSCLAGDDVYLNDYVEVDLIPETLPEFECYFQILINKEFDSSVKNAVLVLPKTESFVDYWGVKLVGGSVVIPGFQKSIGREDQFGNIATIDYWYLIKLPDLSKPVVTVHVPEWIAPHLIGKGGKKIKETLQWIHDAGYKNVRKINLITFKKDSEEDSNEAKV